MGIRRLILVVAALFVVLSPAVVLAIDCTRVDSNMMSASGSGQCMVYNPWVMDGPRIGSQSDPQDANASYTSTASNGKAVATAQSLHRARCNVPQGAWDSVPLVDTTAGMTADVTVTANGGGGEARMSTRCDAQTVFQPQSGTIVNGNLYLVASGGVTGGATLINCLWARCNRSWVTATAAPTGGTINFNVNGVVGGTTIAYVSPGGIDQLFTFQETNTPGATIPLGGVIGAFPQGSNPPTGGAMPYASRNNLPGNSHSQWSLKASAWFSMTP
jgi:hypothetical protein